MARRRRSSAGRINPVAGHGTDEDYLALIRLDLDESKPEGNLIYGQAVRERAPIVVQDVTTDPRIVRKRLVCDNGLHAIAVVPILVKDEAVGIVALHATQADFFDSEEMKLLTELAGDIAFALDHIEKIERLDYLALYDALTGLPNRKLFNERLDQRLAMAVRDKTPVAVAMLPTR